MTIRLGTFVQVAFEWGAQSEEAPLIGEVVDIQQMRDDDDQQWRTRFRVTPLNKGILILDDESYMDWTPGSPLWFDRNELAVGGVA